MRREVLEVNGTAYPVNIHFENRDNSTVSIRKKSINIRVPISINREQMFKEIIKMKAWAKEKILEEPDRFKEAQKKTYKRGDELKIGDKLYKLDIDFRDKESSSARITGDSVSLVISSNLSEELKNKHISTLLSRCIARQRLPALHKRINELNQDHFNKKVNKIFFKYNRSNWGSCSESGNINISTRLLFAPDDVLDYICIHELAHLIEPNHSENYWRLVEKAMPNYKEKEQWLKDNGDNCVF